jgi:hypothetical protein
MNIKNFDNFIFESYGSNQIVRELTNDILNKINHDLGKLILNRGLSISIDNHKEVIFINSLINIRLSNRTYGNMNPKSIILTDNDISNLIINIELELSPSEIISKHLHNNKVKNVISHELLHVMELFLTKRNKKDISKSWEYGEKLNNINKKYNSKNWNDISYLIYLSLPHEMRSKVEELNREIENNGVSGISNTKNFIKTTKIYKDVEFISNINTQNVLNKLKNDENYIYILKEFSKDFLEKETNNYEREFINYFGYIKKKNKKLLEKLLRSSYNFENLGYDQDINYDDYK